MSPDVKGTEKKETGVVFEDEFDALEQELAMARRHELIEDEADFLNADEDTENEENDTETAKEEASEEDVEEDANEGKTYKTDKTEPVIHSSDLDDTFEKMDEDPILEHENLAKFNERDKAFFWKWKKDKKKRQDAVAKAEILELKIKEMESRLDAVSAGKETNIDALLKAEEEKAKNEAPITREEYLADKRRQEEEVRSRNETINRLNSQEIQARKEHEDFGEVSQLAQEIMRQKPHYYKVYMEMANDPNANAAEYVYDIGRLHPGYARLTKKKEPNTEITEEKTKRNTTAALKTSTSSVAKTVEYGDLTIRDAARMSPAQWSKVPYAVRKKLLSQ